MDRIEMSASPALLLQADRLDAVRETVAAAQAAPPQQSPAVIIELSQAALQLAAADAAAR